jgi:methylthioribose-1-phosphate isomerase
MQGVRLTAWELLQEGIPFRVLPDSAVGHLFSRIPISGVVVGADRIARNGDTANKVGTKVLATLAHLYKIPFVVVAPTSTIDLSTPTGEEIPVEYRSDEELRTVLGVRLYGEELKGFNPAFDITPHTYISAIVTEKGIAYPPFSTTLPTLLNS